MNIAIVTGVSSGLGKEFISAIVRKYPKVFDEIWIIARRKERLQEVAASFPNEKFKVLACDLSSEDGLNTVKDTLDKEKPCVKLLINNAGVIGSGKFEEVKDDKMLAMIETNAKAPTMLIYNALAYMKKGSEIINVVSVAGFAPLPYMLVYSSTKAYMYNFSKGLRAELKTKGINVLALCPGNMKTEMFSPTSTSNVTNQKDKVEKLPFLNLQKVTMKTLELSRKKRGVYTPNIVYKGYRALAKIIPHEILLKFIKV